MRLSFPEAVTPHNVEHLRQLVRNGSNKYPGALAVEDCNGLVINLNKLDEKSREAMAKQLMLPSFKAGVKQGPSMRGKTVYRYVSVDCTRSCRRMIQVRALVVGLR
jgi:DNA-directed RNA polymerase I subunit RPA1